MNEDKNELARIIAIAVIAVTVIAAITGAIIYDNSRKSKPVVMTQQEATTPETVAKRVNVTPMESRIITREIERSADMPPAVTYYVQAPTVEKAATETSAAIKKQSPNLPAAVTKKTDRTIVTADNDRQKVNVYKISLRKAHKIKTGMTYVDNHAYLNAGYQAGRWEGLAHFNAEGFKGATVMYTLKEW